MRKRETIWIALLLILGLVYYHFFGSRPPKPLVVLAAWHPVFSHGAMSYSMYFTLNDNYKLTRVKVVALDENGKADPAAPPLWNLISDGNSSPTRAFRYGQSIRGMKPVLADVKADPLIPGTTYQIVISAGNTTGSANFTAREAR